MSKISMIVSVWIDKFFHEQIGHNSPLMDFPLEHHVSVRRISPSTENMS